MQFCVGENIRDWCLDEKLSVIFPYDLNLETLPETDFPKTIKFMWPFRTTLFDMKVFGGQTYRESKKKWFEYGQIPKERYKIKWSIAHAFIATHNHFVLDRGGKVFNRTAPVIKLPEGATERDHLELLGLLNSSTACFWLKQVMFDKGATNDPEKFRFEFDGTKLKKFPIPNLTEPQQQKLVEMTRALDIRGHKYGEFSFVKFIDELIEGGRNLHECLENKISERKVVHQEMVRLQEELDWLCYEFFGFLEKDSIARSLVWKTPSDQLGGMKETERAYRNVEKATWVLGEKVDQARHSLLKSDKTIGLLERPEYKRRWFRSAGAYNSSNLSDELIVVREARTWLLNHLESPGFWSECQLISTAQLADMVREDLAFMAVAEFYRKRNDFAVTLLINDLIENEAVPLLPILRLKPSGLRKYAQWKRTWELQRREDEIDRRTVLTADHPDFLSKENAESLKKKSVGDIPVPPKYTASDLIKQTYFRHRGKLDVHKERFIGFPFCERDADSSPVIGWAGWDHLQQAQAIAAYYMDVKDNEDWKPERLQPLLAALVELQPWLDQWHSEYDPTHDTKPNEAIQAFTTGEARDLGLDPEKLSEWQPPAKAKRGGRRKKAEK